MKNPNVVEMVAEFEASELVVRYLAVRSGKKVREGITGDEAAEEIRDFINDADPEDKEAMQEMVGDMFAIAQVSVDFIMEKLNTAKRLQ